MKEWGKRYLLECYAEINVHDFACAAIEKDIRCVSITQTKDVSDD
jgi:hypothetical protein